MSYRGEKGRQRQFTGTSQAGPASCCSGGLLLTFAQLTPSNCPHGEAVKGVCRQREGGSKKKKRKKKKAEGHQKRVRVEEEEPRHNRCDV